MVCERCESKDSTVKIRDNCKICGPTPLCDECEKVHQGEILIENQRFDEFGNPYPPLQLSRLEQLTFNQLVLGSSPRGGTMNRVNRESLYKSDRVDVDVVLTIKNVPEKADVIPPPVIKVVLMGHPYDFYYMERLQ